jgi:hypothetical protein
VPKPVHCPDRYAPGKKPEAIETWRVYDRSGTRYVQRQFPVQLVQERRLSEHDAKLSDYGVSEVEWDDDIPAGARCAGCDRDATGLLKRADVLTFYRVRLRKK